MPNAHDTVGIIWVALELGGMATLTAAHSGRMFLYGLLCVGAATAMWQFGWIN